MKSFFIFLIRIYRALISPFMGNNCRFEPSCSHYAEQALEKKGLARGFALSLKRILSCHPWHPGGFNPLEQ